MAAENHVLTSLFTVCGTSYWDQSLSQGAFRRLLRESAQGGNFSGLSQVISLVALHENGTGLAERSGMRKADWIITRRDTTRLI